MALSGFVDLMEPRIPVGRGIFDLLGRRECATGERD